MGRPRKDPDDRLETQLDPQQPIPVTVVPGNGPNPWLDKYPRESDPVEKRKYKFTYNQSPGMPLEFTYGRSVVKGNGKPGTFHESFCFEDGFEYEIPVDVAKHLNKLVYSEQGTTRPRCTCVEVD